MKLQSGRFILILFTSISTISCQESVTFTEPQPPNAIALEKFPKSIQGDYQNKEYDGEVLQIKPELILRFVDYHESISEAMLDSNQYKIDSNLIVSSDKKEIYPFKRKGDSLLININSVDTIFQISDNHVLTKYKGNLFLNTLVDTLYWHVTMLHVQKESLRVSNISSKEEIDLLREITETTQDTLSEAFSPTRKQFKKFITSGGFANSSQYIRIKK